MRIGKKTTARKCTFSKSATVFHYAEDLQCNSEESQISATGDVNTADDSGCPLLQSACNREPNRCSESAQSGSELASHSVSENAIATDMPICSGSSSVENKKLTEHEVLLNDPNYPVILSFFETFGPSLGLHEYPLLLLEEHLSTMHGPINKRLADLHLFLLKRLAVGKNVNKEKLFRILSRFALKNYIEEAVNIDEVGYSSLCIPVKLKILKYLLECQFDENAPFKHLVADRDPADLQLKPMGRDRYGFRYWYFADLDLTLRLYKESPDEEKCVFLVAQNHTELEDITRKLVNDDVLKNKFKDWNVEVPTYDKYNVPNDTHNVYPTVNGVDDGKAETVESTDRIKSESPLTDDIKTETVKEEEVTVKLEDEGDEHKPAIMTDEHSEPTCDVAVLKICCKEDKNDTVAASEACNDNNRISSDGCDVPKVEICCKEDTNETITTSEACNDNNRFSNDGLSEDEKINTVNQSTSKKTKKRKKSTLGARSSRKRKADKMAGVKSVTSELGYDENDDDLPIALRKKLRSSRCKGSLKETSFVCSEKEEEVHSDAFSNVSSTSESSDDYKHCPKLPKEVDLEATQEESVCYICKTIRSLSVILLCDGCDDSYHPECLIPPLVNIPCGNWYCPMCEQKFLCEKLIEKLKPLLEKLHELELVKIQSALKRQDRLAEVGANLDNLFRQAKQRAKTQKKRKPKVYSDDEENNSKTQMFEPLGPRSCRVKANINYRFDEYDNVIREAIGETFDAFEPLTTEEKSSKRTHSDDDDYCGTNDEDFRESESDDVSLCDISISEVDDPDEEFRPRKSHFSRGSERTKHRKRKKNRYYDDYVLSDEQDDYVTKPLRRSKRVSSSRVIYHEYSSSDDDDIGQKTTWLSKAAATRKRRILSSISEKSMNEEDKNYHRVSFSSDDEIAAEGTIDISISSEQKKDLCTKETKHEQELADESDSSDRVWQRRMQLNRFQRNKVSVYDDENSCGNTASDKKCNESSTETQSTLIDSIPVAPDSLKTDTHNHIQDTSCNETDLKSTDLSINSCGLDPLHSAESQQSSENAEENVLTDNEPHISSPLSMVSNECIRAVPARATQSAHFELAENRLLSAFSLNCNDRNINVQREELKADSSVSSKPTVSPKKCVKRSQKPKKDIPAYMPLTMPAYCVDSAQNPRLFNPRLFPPYTNSINPMMHYRPAFSYPSNVSRHFEPTNVYSEIPNDCNVNNMTSPFRSHLNCNTMQYSHANTSMDFDNPEDRESDSFMIKNILKANLAADYSDNDDEYV